MLGARLRPGLQPASCWLLRSRFVASAPPPTTPTAEQKKEIEQCFSRLDLTFQNTKEAFKVGFGYKCVIDGLDDARVTFGLYLTRFCVTR